MRNIIIIVSVNIPDIPLRTFKIVVGSVGSLAVLLLVILTIVIAVATVKRCVPWIARRRHGDRELVECDEN